jgi:uncharacterized protein YjeT (DUF2065 family)
VKNVTFTAGFTIVCLVLIAAGALQCFAPARLKEIQDKLRPRGDYSQSAFGSFFEKLREEEARQPSVLYRFSGFMLMSIGAFMLVMGMLVLWR